MKKAKAIFTEYLSHKKLRMTPQRQIMLEVFLKTESHITSEELYNIVKTQDKSIGQATVYRMLKLLSDSGIAREVDFNDGATRYEHKYGHTHHDHIICEACRESIEILDEKIEKLQNDIAKKYGFVLSYHKMYLFGICKKCREK